MSFTDEASATLFSGMDKANRAGQVAKINIEKARLAQQRQSLMRDLGNVAYPTLQGHPEMVPEAQEVITRIMDLDQRVTSLDAELVSLRSPAVVPPSGGQGAGLVCPRCGSVIAPGVNFCMVCGMPRAEAERQAGVAAAGEPPESTLVPPVMATAPEKEPEPPVSDDAPAAAEDAGQKDASATNVTPTAEVSPKAPTAEETSLPDDATQVVAPTENASADEGVATSTRYCPHCGHEVDSNAKFCMWCGGALNPASE